MGVVLRTGLGFSRRFYDRRKFGWAKHTAISAVLRNMSFTRSKEGSVCTLYVLAKAKSLLTKECVFRGSLASPAPIISWKHQRIVVRSMLCKLYESIDHTCQFTEIRQVSNWFKWVVGKGACNIAKVDCKKKQVVPCATKAVSWEYHKHRRRASQVVRSVHHQVSNLDRVVVANNNKFWHMAHELLERLLRFKRLHNNVLHAVGKFHTKCRPLHPSEDQIG